MNEKDIMGWEENKNNGLFHVEYVEIEDYDEEGNQISETSQWWAVCDNIDNTTCYEVRNKHVADNLCDHLNMLTTDLMFDKELPEEIAEAISDDLKTLADYVNMKITKMNKLAVSMEHELACELVYLHKSNDLKINPAAIKDDLELNKLPTEKQTAAYIENKLSYEYDMWRIAKANTSLLKQQIGLLDDMISYAKYALRLKS